MNRSLSEFIRPRVLGNREMASFVPAVRAGDLCVAKRITAKQRGYSILSGDLAEAQGKYVTGESCQHKPVLGEAHFENVLFLCMLLMYLGKNRKNI